MNISDRLTRVANMVDRCKTMADIGTDHGYIPIFLLINGICERAIASDINRGPVQRAEENIKYYGLENKIECRQGPGLSTLKAGEVQTAVIAGMGGHLIISILEEEEIIAHKLESIVLQPVQHSKVLRKYLYENGYKIIDEDLCYDEGKYYEIIKASYDGTNRYLEDIYYEISPLLIEKKHSLLKEYLGKKIHSNDKILCNINEDTEGANKRKEELININEKLKELLTCL
ncbi:MAG: SAM-dependent methyltransferase [Clostridiales bacterium]|uniref:tRNA (adenine(22)-N(1))-methyltransferase n=1 Tax=Clostridium sp. N3C TaxID=1776758 RepID=UPI00092E04A7|nr:class I SAM-dependent methyltransferase [Clostridium sp. N3C]NLZ49941.1 SAM-dependent methyltransferase [Clostridiales bacterium]SCN21818.1 tRNA (adenine(22)-N(1))-methyltransferase [Clostridium sp. N3C]